MLAGLLILAGVFATPSAWRGALALWGPSVEDQPPSYLPALEDRRLRAPFEPVVADDLRRLDPGHVIIGDSMAGRIDPDRLTELSQDAVGPILHNATGPAFWYLVLKNWVVPSGVRPEWVFIFFRDTNLTDVMFRLDGAYRGLLDQVARDREPELNAVVAARLGGGWSPVHDALNDLYRVDRAREWFEPLLLRWPARRVDPERTQRVIDRANEAFVLTNLRPMGQADIEVADVRRADVNRYAEASTLPLMLDLAREHDLRLGFVRVLRRPENGHPPDETPEMTQYIADLRAYIEARGGVLFDDRRSPELARLPYDDGDHVAREARVPYTDFFWQRLQAFEQELSR